MNHVVDRAGASLVPELVRGLGAEVPEVLYAWLSADRLLGAEALRESATGDTEAARLRARVAVESAVAQAAALALGLEGRALLEPDDEAKRAAQIGELRERLGAGADALPLLVRALPALRVAERSGAPLARALELWNELGARTRIHWLLDRLPEAELGDGWSRLSASALSLEMCRTLCELCERELLGGGPRRAARARGELERGLARVDELASQIDAGSRSFAPLLALSQRIRRLC